MPADSGAAAGDFTWMLSIHPRLLVHCAVQPPSTAASVSRVLADAAAEWIASRGGPDMFSAGELEEMERRSAAIAMFITGDHWGASSAMAAAGAGAGASTDTGVLASGTDERRTVVEDQALAKDILSLDVSKPALAMLQLSYCYLTGLRLFEKEQYQSAHAWFARGVELASASLSAQQQQQQNQQQQPAAPLMAQNAEKDRILRAALESQLNVHMLLADLHCQIDQGASIGDLAEDIDAVMEAQVAIRFEFLERIVTASLRQGNKAVFTKLVGTIATNQKLWQQLPEIHLALLQFASLLVVIYDILQGVGIDIAREVAGGSSGIDLDALPAEALEGLRASVAEVAGLLLKIPVGGGRSADIDPRTVLGCSPRPGTKSENEVERFCRMWGDPEYLAMLGALVAEILHAGSGESVTGPLGLCALVALIIRKSPDAGAADGQRSSNERDVSPMDTDDVGGRSIVGALINNSTDQGRKNMQHMQDTALVVFKCVARAMPADACVWLYFSAVATGERLESAFMPLFVEFLGLHTDAFSPAALDKCVGQAWFQQRLPAMIRSLVALNMSGAAAVLHQCAAEVNYSAAIPLVAQAFESGEIDQAVAGFFWDPDIIEYAQYLSRLPSSPTRVEFAVPSMELLSSRTLILSAYFQWLAAVLSRK
ncbi:hypothetical protein LPJ61_004656 [Coemansia biformis]|uniref:Uncharacterized protein n=1 Tax=Coemansia biformis TaxID=1286918 RepID=A0A9W7YBE8_9FUNG|nr:hypothetical protein LPJ61_004656 [Coemansia biformis]